MGKHWKQNGGVKYPFQVEDLIGHVLCLKIVIMLLVVKRVILWPNLDHQFSNCSRRMEVVYSEVYMLDGDMKWKTLPPMQKPDSHIEFAWALVNNSIVIAGGTTKKHPITKKNDSGWRSVSV